MTTKILLGRDPECSILYLHAFNIQGTIIQQKRNFPFVIYITFKKKNLEYATLFTFCSKDSWLEDGILVAT